MQNRVKRLLFEEERARTLESLAKNKADRMLEARDRHQKVIILSGFHTPLNIGIVLEVSTCFSFFDNRIGFPNSYSNLFSSNRFLLIK